MQALAKLSVLPTFVRRACVAVAPVLKYATSRHTRVDPDCEQWAPDCDPGASLFRVTDRRRRWSKVRHFMDVDTALRYSYANDGVVWERYVGPTGATNWWSLTDQECEERLCVEQAADGSAARLVHSSDAAV
jgi:hypothetical protein